MRRRPLALAWILSALTATIASAQSYPQQPYAMDPNGMPPGAMYPGYGGQGPMGMPQPYPAQGAMPQGWAGGQGMPSQTMYSQSGGMPLGRHRHYSGKASPQMRLPPGVHAENGVLYYDGKAYADSNYSQPSPYYPVRLAIVKRLNRPGQCKA